MGVSDYRERLLYLENGGKKMAVFRVEKTKNYVVMATYHVRDNSLSLKATGLMTKILSLPDSWDYSIRGLASICRDGVDSISGTLKELEAAGYIVRNKIRDDKGRICDTEYIIYEMPRRLSESKGSSPDKAENKRHNSYSTKNPVNPEGIGNRQSDASLKDSFIPQVSNAIIPGASYDQSPDNAILPANETINSAAPDKKTTFMKFTVAPRPDSLSPGMDIEPGSDEPYTRSLYPACPHPGNPYMDEPNAEPPYSEKRPQISIKESSINELNTNALNINQSIRTDASGRAAATAGDTDRIDRMDGIDEPAYYKRFIQNNISYDCLIAHYQRERVDEAVELILDTVLSKRRRVRIAGDDKPADVVKSRLLKLNSQHIEYVFECMDANTAKIGNIKAYLLTSLYNAPSTMDSYYAARVNHDMNRRGAAEYEKPFKGADRSYDLDFD